MNDETDWSVEEMPDLIEKYSRRVKINEQFYSINPETACIAHAILCLMDELRNVKDELRQISRAVGK